MSVERERHGRTELLIINRPEARNAIDGATSESLSKAFDELEEDEEVWAVIITGAGDKAFSAGMDLKAFAAGEGGAIAGAKGGFAGIAKRQFPKPLIAAVNGYALGGGCEIALSCDVIVAAEHAMFGLPEVTRGLIAGAGGLIRLPRRLPLSVALELGMSGQPIDAKKALSLGLVNRVVPSNEVVGEALRIAEAICANAPLAVRATKRVMRKAYEMTEEEAWTLSDSAVGEVFSSADAMEGAVAFAEKREPRWQGR
ncbi:MAG: crotonase/enoyl-CoA hydratase family protein [Actinobacteria bacterium]|jgi:enoyl-CoA hydratase|nr:crotonase/enoyl-CoA hydratase family protein [Actinomycetota bacterium]MCL6094689.1 crotonase/enoyl-CoA hydratase family protein [Actinomycetota bacterium]